MKVKGFKLVTVYQHTGFGQRRPLCFSYTTKVTRREIKQKALALGFFFPLHVDVSLWESDSCRLTFIKSFEIQKGK